MWREGCAYLGKENGEEKPKKLAAGGQRDEPSITITLCHTLSYFAIFGAFLEWAFLDCSLLFAIYYLLWSSISARLGSLEAPTGPLQLFGAVRFRELFASISCNTEFLKFNAVKIAMLNELLTYLPRLSLCTLTYSKQHHLSTLTPTFFLEINILSLLLSTMSHAISKAEGQAGVYFLLQNASCCSWQIKNLGYLLSFLAFAVLYWLLLLSIRELLHGGELADCLPA